MIIDVVVKSSAKENKVEKAMFDNSYVVYTKEPSIDGRANKSVIKILSEYFNVTMSMVNIKRGFRSKYKVVEVLSA